VDRTPEETSQHPTESGARPSLGPAAWGGARLWVHQVRRRQAALGNSDARQMRRFCELPTPAGGGALAAPAGGGALAALPVSV
jgi:hypothetical protein